MPVTLSHFTMISFSKNKCSYIQEWVQDVSIVVYIKTMSLYANLCFVFFLMYIVLNGINSIGLKLGMREPLHSLI